MLSSKCSSSNKILNVHVCTCMPHVSSSTCRCGQCWYLSELRGTVDLERSSGSLQQKKKPRQTFFPHQHQINSTKQNWIILWMVWGDIECNLCSLHFLYYWYLVGSEFNFGHLLLLGMMEKCKCYNVGLAMNSHLQGVSKLNQLGTIDLETLNIHCCKIA